MRALNIRVSDNYIAYSYNLETFCPYIRWVNLPLLNAVKLLLSL